MRIFSALFLIALILTGCHRASSGLILPSLLSDNMVLQQNTDARLWGLAAPGTRIKINTSWDAKGQTSTDEGGHWSVEIPVPEAGGPYSMTVSASDTTIEINNILVGEVWFCSGQSNMEMPLAGWPPKDTIMYSAITLASASLPELRLFNVNKNVSGVPLDECTGRWEISSPLTAAPFSATAFFFGKKLYDELGVPVGLIESAWGGTPSEAWTSAAYLENSGEFIPILKSIKESASLMEEYQGWLNTLKQLTIKPAGKEQWTALAFDDNDFQSPEYDDSDWSLTDLPGQFERTTGELDGAVWFRRTIDIPEDFSGKELILSLGPIDDMDRTWFNGVLVGATEISGMWQSERNYPVPEKVVRKGANTIAVRVIDTQGGGGIYGLPGSMKLGTKEGNTSPLIIDGEWRYKVAAELRGDRFYLTGSSANDFSRGKRPVPVGPGSPSSLYNAMVAPVVKYPVRGAVWYQGESNVGREKQYEKIFPLMINNWREAWGIPEMPFYFVQIAPYIYSNADSSESVLLREAQAAALKLPKTGMVVTLDVATVLNIHPPFKKEVGERLAYLALANDYGKSIPCEGPSFRSIAKEGNSLKVSFDNAGEGLIAGGTEITGFEIAGKDRKFMKASAKIIGNDVFVSSPGVPDPQAVRYCWRNGSVGNILNSFMLPAPQFKADL